MDISLRYIESFLEMLAAERSVAKNTNLAYKRDLLDLYAFNPNLNKLRQSELEDFIANLAERGLSAKSRARKISAIKQFYLFLLSESEIKNNPAINLELPKQPANLPKALHQLQVEKLFTAARLNNSNEGLRSMALLELLYSSGMRISELIALKLSSIRDNSNHQAGLQTLVIKGKGGRERIIMLNHSAVNALDEYIKTLPHDGNGYLFPSSKKNGVPTHITRQRCFQLLKQIAINAGLPPEIVSPHKIRHSFATHILANGANLKEVQALLGHSDISSTQIYTKVANEKAMELVTKLHPLAASD